MHQGCDKRQGGKASVAFVCLLAVLGASLIVPVAATAQPAPGQIPLVTRWVAEYSQYELKLVDAFRGKDRAAIDRLVSESFEVVTSDPADPQIMRQNWIDSNLASSGRLSWSSSSCTNMATYASSVSP